MIIKNILIFMSSLVLLGFTSESQAKLKVVTTTTTLADIAREIGGDKIQVSSFTKGPQDPHFVEAKPSYMVEARSADLVISVGLDLEIGWLPNILRGSKNPKIMPGQVGYLDASQFVKPIEVLSGRIDRSQGDIHALGNPHYLLDPVRTSLVVIGISDRLAKLDPDSKNFFEERAKDLVERIETKVPKWKERIGLLNVSGVVTYHRTLSYFLSRFELKFINAIEPKPGIPPAARHIVQLINQLKSEKRACIFVESFFETSEAERIRKSTGSYVVKVPTEVGATDVTSNYLALIESLIAALEECVKKGPMT